MDRAAAKPLCIRHASLDDQAQALAILFAHLLPGEQDKQIVRALAGAVESPPKELWVGYRGEQLVGAVWAQVQPGRTALILPPRVAEPEPPETAGELLAHVTDDLARREVDLVQSLLETDHGPDVKLLEQHGFRRISNLLYLVSLQASFPTSVPQSPLEFEPFRPEADVRRLAELVERTYVGSLDCPELDDVRKIDDVLEGYRATGVFHATRWMFARHFAKDVGCLLLTDHPRNNGWELIYLGVVPEARGQGWGVAMTRHAQWLTRQAGRERLVLAVDAINEPAIAVYAECGFVAWDHRSVFLRAL